MQQLPLSYTWEGIIDFLSYHQSILKAREDQFDQEKLKFNIRIVQLEQEVVSLKTVNEQMSSRISELEVKLGVENAYTRISRQGQSAKVVKNKHHSRVKSDLVQNFGQNNEELFGNNSVVQRQNRVPGYSFHGGSSSISFYQTGNKGGTLNLSNTVDGITGKSLVHQFLQNVGYEQEDSQNIGLGDQTTNSFLKFDNLFYQNKQSSSVNNSAIGNNNIANNGNNTTNNGNNTTNNGNGIGGDQTGFESIHKNGKQKKAKKLNGSQTNTIIYNQTTVNSINSNNFISAYNNQQMQINQSVQNSFISGNKQQTTPSSTSSSQQNPPFSTTNAQHQQQNQGSLRLHEAMSKSTPSNQLASLNHHNLMSSQNSTQKQQQKVKTNIQDATFVNNGNSSSQGINKNVNQSIAQSNNKTNHFINTQTIHSNLNSSHPITDSNENQIITGKKIWNPKCTLRSHLDGVRSLFFTAVDPILVTASEDCSIKLWDTRQFKDHNENQYLQPYYTIRGHSGQIFTITGNQQQLDSNINYQSYNFIFSAGVDGVIKAWNLPLPQEIDALGPSEGKNVGVGEWQAHHEAIWDLNHHPFQPILLSSGADGYIKLWKTFEKVEGTSLLSLQQGDLMSYLSYKPGQYQDIPTSVAWDQQRTSIISGWVQSNNLVSFDSETSKISAILKYTQDNPNLSAQVNKVICHEGINCAISGHEDRQIRFFDLNSNTLIKNLIGHTDAVTGLSVHPNKFYMSSVGHDGSMRTWDIRKYQCIHDIPVILIYYNKNLQNNISFIYLLINLLLLKQLKKVHKRKYDESVHSVMYHQELPLIATGGADGLIKIFHQQDMI